METLREHGKGWGYKGGQPSHKPLAEDRTSSRRPRHKPLPLQRSNTCSTRSTRLPVGLHMQHSLLVDERERERERATEVRTWPCVVPPGRRVAPPWPRPPRLGAPSGLYQTLRGQLWSMGWGHRPLAGASHGAYWGVGDPCGHPLISWAYLQREHEQAAEGMAK